MDRSRDHLRTLHRLTAPLVAALLSVAVGARAEAGKTPVLKRGFEEVDARNARVLEHWDHAAPAQVRPLGGKSASVIEMRTAQEKLFIIRRPRDRVGPGNVPVRGIDHSMRVNLAQQRLAAQLGEPKLVAPAARTTSGPNLAQHIPVGTEIMVVKHVGAKYQNASIAPAEWVQKIPEKLRLISAIVDLLYEHRDRKTENVMVREDGTIRLIDPDKCCGQGRDNKAFRSQFFPSGKLAYTSAQARLADLPQEMQEVIGTLATMDVPSIAETYGVLPTEAQILAQHAQRIHQVGLTAAINEYVKSLGPLRADQ